MFGMPILIIKMTEITYNHAVYDKRVYRPIHPASVPPGLRGQRFCVYMTTEYVVSDPTFADSTLENADTMNVSLRERHSSETRQSDVTSLHPCLNYLPSYL